MTDMAISGAPAASTSFLRGALKLDAVVSGVNGVAYLVAAEPLEDLLGLDAALLRAVGAFLVVYAAFVWITGTRARIPRPAVLAIIGGNAVWAIASIVPAIAGWDSPTTTGTVWIVLQGITVAAFAELQLTGLRRSER
jgi:hypothetical protein